MKLYQYFIISLAVIILDQATKLMVHFNMHMGEFGEISLIGDWFKLHYTLNEGMAFGIKFGSNYGKLFLTLFRWVAMFGIAFYLYTFARKQLNTSFLISIALILGGAVGNVLDSTFYGVFLDNAPYMENLPPFYPWFHGQVVDMFYLDIWQGYLPDWLPFAGGGYYSLWPIFNIADAAIFSGVATILVFQKKFFPQTETEFQEVEVEVSTENNQARS